MNTSDRFDLHRFVDAQSDVYATVVEELRAGTKRSHWMWFVFPQFAGLGLSAMSRRYAIGSLTEAAAHADHPLLGPRLIECTQLVLASAGRSLLEIFGRPDDAKFWSCMTLFSLIEPHHRCFDDALATFWAGAPDPLTVSLAFAAPAS